MKQIFIITIFFLSFKKIIVAQNYQYFDIQYGVGGFYNDTTNDLLYVSGTFSHINGLEYWHIATWNGLNWDTLSRGVNYNNPNGAGQIVKYNGNIIVGGAFDSAGYVLAPAIASWNGVEWSGFNDYPIISNYGYGVIADMEVHNNLLYVVGHFDSIGNQAIKNVACWNGTFWSSVGDYNDYSASSQLIHNLKFVGNDLFVSGLMEDQFSTTHHIAKYDGTSWSYLPEIPNLQTV